MRRLAFQAMSKMSPKMGNGAHEDADAEIDGHAHQGDVGNAANPGGQGNDQREQAGEHVAEAGNEADDAVEAEADSGAGDAEGFVEKDFEAVQGAVAEEPGAAVPALRRSAAGSAPVALSVVAAGNGFCAGLGMGSSVAAGASFQTRFDATIIRVYGGYSSAAERLTVAQDVVGSIPTSRPKLEINNLQFETPPSNVQ